VYRGRDAVNYACYFGGLTPDDLSAYMNRTIRLYGTEQAREVLQEWVTCLSTQWSQYLQNPSAN